MTKLLGISGSLRAKSFNTAPLRAAHRLPADVFKDRPVAVIGASPGGFGTILSQSHWLPVLRALGVRHWSGGRLMVSRAAAVFAADGSLQDDVIRRQLADFIAGFATYVQATAPSQKAVI